MIPRARGLWALACFVALTGGACSSQLAWYGHTPDRVQRIELRQRGHEQWLLVGDRESARYQSIAMESLVLSERSRRIAFAAMQSARDTHAGSTERWHAVVDLKQGPAWDGVAQLRFGPFGDRFVYAAERDQRWHVVVDGEVGPAFDALAEGSIAFSPDARRVGYVAQRGACAYAVVAGELGACHARVLGLSLGDVPEHDLRLIGLRDGRVALRVGGDQPAVLDDAGALYPSPGGTRWAVSARLSTGACAREGSCWALIVDGVPEPSFDAIGSVVWAPDDSRVVYTARRGRLWQLIDAGRPGPEFERIERPVFSRDARHLAYVGRGAMGSAVVLDSRMRWSSPSPTATALTLSDDGARMGWVYRSARGPTLVVDGNEVAFQVVVDGSLRFSRDGRHWAALVGSLARRRLFITVDGHERLPFDSQELFGGALRDLPVRSFLGGWVSAELERHLKHEPRGDAS